MLVPGTIVIAHDGKQSLGQTEDRHENKGLKFKIQAKNRVGSRRKPGQNPVHSDVHYGSDTLHNDSRKADSINILDDTSKKLESPECDINFMSSSFGHKDADKHADPLSGNSCDSSSGYTHGRQSEISENKDRIQDNIADRTNQLKDHRPDHIAGSLKRLLQHCGNKHTYGKNTADGNVSITHGNDLRIGFEQSEKRCREKSAINGEDSRSQHTQNQPVHRSKACLFPPFFTKPARNQRCYTNSCTDGKSNHQILYRHSQ